MSGGGWGTRGSCCGVEDVARPVEFVLHTAREQVHDDVPPVPSSVVAASPIDICGGRCAATAPAVAALDGIIVIVGDDSADLLGRARAVATLPHRETRAHRVYPLLGACGSPPYTHLEPSLLMPCHLALLDPSRSCEYAQQGREDARGRWKRKGDTRSKDESSSQSRESVRAARQRGEKASSTRRQRAVCEASVRASARLVASEREDGSQVVDIAQRVARVLVFLGDLSRSASRGVDDEPRRVVRHAGERSN